MLAWLELPAWPVGKTTKSLQLAVEVSKDHFAG